MNIQELGISGVFRIEPKKISDRRGFFMECYKSSAFQEAGITTTFTQENQSQSVEVNTVRGLHFQTPPMAQAKLVRCVRGRLLDVAVDLRLGSPTYGQVVVLELSADNALQLFIPAGCAHGFRTLEPMTEILYKVDAPYAPTCDSGLRWDDPTLMVPWDCTAEAAILSDKDRALPFFRDFRSPFSFSP